MSSLWNPTFWTGLSGPAVAMFVCALFLWALVTERLAIGKQFRAERARADRLEAANRELTEALIEKNAGEVITTSLLSALRREVAAKVDEQ